MKRWRVALETGATVMLIVVVKVVIEIFSLDFIVLSPLYTSVVAGGTFVIGLLVAGTLADYKEAERMPAELTSALEAIHEDAVSIKVVTPDFDLARLSASLRRVVASLLDDLAVPEARSCLAAVSDLSPSFVEMDRLGVPPNYIVRLRGEQSTIRRIVYRVYHIQRTLFLPSAYLLIQSIVFLILVALLFTKFDPLYQSIVVLIFIAYFFIYLVKLLGILDTPFHASSKTMDDVSLFLLKEFARHMDEDAEGERDSHAPH